MEAVLSMDFNNKLIGENIYWCYKAKIGLTWCVNVFGLIQIGIMFLSDLDLNHSLV